MGFLSEVPMGNEFAPFVAFQQARGFIPNLLQAQSLLPRVIEAQTILENAVLRDGAISQIRKERILLRIAAHRQDTYCMSARSPSVGQRLTSELYPRRKFTSSMPDISCWMKRSMRSPRSFALFREKKL